MVSEDWYVVSHRLPIIRAIRASGHEVCVLTNVNSDRLAIEQAGAVVVPIPLARRSRNPFIELRALLRVWRGFRQFQPDVVHNVGLKPMLYGSIAARLTRRRPAVVNAVAGLGALAEPTSPAASAIRRALVLALRTQSDAVIVQNESDARMLLMAGIGAERIWRTLGSGVDLDRFAPVPEPPTFPPVVLYVGRLLQIKGLEELVAAAGIVAKRGVPARFRIVGSADPANPTSISQDVLDAWSAYPGLELAGRVDDVLPELARCHMVVLPSRGGEGVPKSILEASAVGRPAIVTAVPGCSDAVEHEVTGLLVPPRDPNALADAIARLVSDVECRARYGRAAADRARERFSDVLVAEQTLRCYASVVGG